MKEIRMSLAKKGGVLFRKIAILEKKGDISS